MNFEKSYASNFQNLFERDGSYAVDSAWPTSPKAVADFENRPILSYTIPTNDCSSPGTRARPPSFSRPRDKNPVLSRSVAEIGKAFVVAAGEEERGGRRGDRLVDSSLRASAKAGSVGGGGCKPRSKTPTPIRTRDRSPKRSEEDRVAFVRMSSTRRSLQVSTADRTGRPQTATPAGPGGRYAKFLPQLTREDFMSKINFLRNRSKSVQRAGSPRSDDDSNTADELLTDQTMPSLDIEDRGGGGGSFETRGGCGPETPKKSAATTGCGTAGFRNGGVNGIKRSLTVHTGFKTTIRDTIREGLVTPSPSPTSSESDGRMNFGRCHQNSTPSNRRVAVQGVVGQSPSTSKYSRDDLNNNCIQRPAEGTRTGQFSRFASLRLPRSSPSPLVTKKRISFAFDQNSENSSENDYSVGSSEGYTGIRDLLEKLNSSDPQVRRDGLYGLQMVIERTPDMLSEADVKRVSETFTKMFHDPQTKVVSSFLEVLPSFVSAYAQQHQQQQQQQLLLSHQWLSVCLHRLFAKCGTELLGSVQVKMKKALEAIRDSFTCEQHFEVMNSLANNHTLMHNAKSRDCFVAHAREFVNSVDPPDLRPTADLAGLVFGLVSLHEKYHQSLELKKNVQAILITIFDLSPPTFSAIMHSQPRGVQDFMTKMARQHVNSTVARDVASTSSSSSSLSFVSSSNQRAPSQSRDGPDNRNRKQVESTQSSSNSSDSAGPSTRNAHSRSSPSSTAATTTTSSSLGLARRPSVKGHRAEAPADPRSPFQSRIPQKVEAPTRSAVNAHNNINNNSDDDGRSGSINKNRGASASGNCNGNINNAFFSTPQVVRKVSLSRTAIFGSTQLSRSSSTSDSRRNVSQREDDRQDDVFSDERSRNGPAAARSGTDAVLPPRPPSSPRRGIPQLGDCTDEEYLAAEMDVFVEHFANVDIENKTEWRKALKQLAQQLPLKPDLISDGHLTSLMTVLLSAPEDIDECSLIVAECLTTLLKSRRIDQSLLVLKEILDRDDQSNAVQTLRWIKFQLDGVEASEARSVIGGLIGSLMKASDSSDRSVRTVTIMVLVQIHKMIGDEIWQHFGDINQHKRTLLQMYFRRPFN